MLSGVRTHRGLRHVWTTFSNDQIDLNYQNTDVLLEFVDIMLYYFRRGARMVRLDAVASAGFGLSRQRMADRIREGAVRIDWVPVRSRDRPLFMFSSLITFLIFQHL